METIDETIPKARWEFDAEVTRVFDDMLERSIPQYQTMRNAVYEVGRQFVRPGTSIVDLGASRGEALDAFTAFHPNTFYACEVSDPMLDTMRERFRGKQDTFVVKHDLRFGYPAVKKTSLTLLVLTLQFVPINYRQRILAEAWDRTTPGGALILVEKILGASARLDDIFVDRYHVAKGHAGYSDHAIERKRLALEGVLVPVTAAWNEDLLHRAGFQQVDCFWRWMNFAAWVAVKS